MATKKATATQTTISGMRRCIGSTTFGIEAHEAPVDDFPVQASARDGLGRMCRSHWTEYTRALRKASVARKAAEVAEGEPTPDPIADPDAATPRKGRRARTTPEPAADAA
jgi:hypothetical protein